MSPVFLLTALRNRRFASRIVFAIALVLSLFLITLAISRTQFADATPADQPSVETEAVAPPAGLQPRDQITAELITITPRGFEPSQISRPAGRVLFAVVNRAEFETMPLRLQRENGAVTAQIQMPRHRRGWNFTVDLQPGSYKIVDPTRSEMICEIEITP